MGPPASRIASCPVSRVRTNFTNRRSGIGFFGTSGSAPTLVVVVTMAMRIARHVPGRKRYATPSALASGRTSRICAHKTKIGATRPLGHIRCRTQTSRSDHRSND